MVVDIKNDYHMVCFRTKINEDELSCIIISGSSDGRNFLPLVNKT